ncbi:hypothetical protein TNCV_3611771, partial [Trichonephila clavipes]
EGETDQAIEEPAEIIHINQDSEMNIRKATDMKRLSCCLKNSMKKTMKP